MNLLEDYLVPAHQQQLLDAARRRRLERDAGTRRFPSRRPWRRSPLA